jgi:hypothetical protein
MNERIAVRRRLRVRGEFPRVFEVVKEVEHELSADDTVLRILVTEQTYAGGKRADGRVLDPDLYEDEQELILTIFVTPLEGFLMRSPNPETPACVALSQPVGGRELIDGAVYEHSRSLSAGAQVRRPHALAGAGPGVAGRPNGHRHHGRTTPWPRAEGGGRRGPLAHAGLAAHPRHRPDYSSCVRAGAARAAAQATFRSLGLGGLSVAAGRAEQPRGRRAVRVAEAVRKQSLAAATCS